jgi:hypothetical protein
MKTPLISDLRIYFPLTESNQEAFLEAVAQITEQGDPKVVKPIILLADDKCQLEGVMKHMLTLLETVELSAYIRELLDVLPEFYLRSPRWASDAVISLLSGKDESVELTNQLMTRDPQTQNLVRNIQNLTFKSRGNQSLN